MPRIPIVRVEEGMVLCRPVVGPSGALIAEAGTKMTTEIKLKLVTGGVRHVYVTADPNNERLKQELDALEARFSKSEDVPPMRMVHELVREHLEDLYR